MSRNRFLVRVACFGLACWFCVGLAWANKSSGAVESGSVDQLLAKQLVPGAAGVPDIAAVNGVAIDREVWLAELIDAYGFEVLRELVSLELAKQLAAQQHVQVGPEQIRQEHRRLVDKIAPAKDLHGQVLDRQQRQRIVKQMLSRAGSSFEMFKLMARRNAYLRAVAAARVKITEQMLVQQYNRQYGPRVEVRHIQLPDLKLAGKVGRMLEQGRDFAELAKQFSSNTRTAVNEGLMPAFSRDDPEIPALIRQVAFSLEPGQVSVTLKVASQYHILKLDRHLPASGQGFQQVRKQLQDDLKDRRTLEIMAKLQKNLFERGRVKISDGKLADKYQSWLAEYIRTE